MYSNDLTQIRSGLVNYIGAMIKAINFPKASAHQLIAGVLTEEALKLTLDENSKCDLFISKPIIRANIFIFKKQCEELRNLIPHIVHTDPNLAEQMAIKLSTFEDMIKICENIINNVDNKES